YWQNEFKPIIGHSEKWETDKVGEKQRALTVSLLKRKAVPVHRLKWLEDPNFFIGSKKSRLQTFSENYGAADDRIFSHPHWYSNGYLPFLVGVIWLPERVIEEFREDARSRMNNGYDMGMKYRAVAKSRAVGYSRKGYHFGSPVGTTLPWCLLVAPNALHP